jgi:hypothetical protein
MTCNLYKLATTKYNTVFYLIVNFRFQILRSAERALGENNIPITITTFKIEGKIKISSTKGTNVLDQNEGVMKRNVCFKLYSLE